MISFYKSLKILLCISTLLTYSQCSWLGCEDDDYYDEEEEDCTYYKPSDCIEEEPEYGDVTIRVTLNSLNPEVPITIFVGDVEDNNIVLQDTIKTTSKTYRLGYTYYSALAIYRAVINDNLVTINSINGKEIEYQEEIYCDGTCYTEGSIEIDVEL